MRIRQLILYLLVISLITTVGCAKRITINYDEAQPNALVKIKTFSGQTCHGVIQEKKTDFLLLKANRLDNHLTKIKREEIASITGHDFVFDGQGEIISEWEIQENQKSKNFFLYTIGGAGLSFGASFFIGSLIHRSIDDTERGNKLLWGTTALGTSAFTYLFAKNGKKRDRLFAIENIREQRFKSTKEQFEDQKKKRDAIRQQLEKEKAEQAKQQQELKQLQEKIKEEKK